MGATQQLLAAYGEVPFVGPLDALIAQGATVARAWSQRRLLSSYTGAADILRGNGTGSPEAMINFLGNGDYDLTAAEAARVAAGGFQAFRKTWYDQSGGGFHATQATNANQPPFTTSVRAKGAIGGAASTDCFLPFTGSIAQPFFVYAIVTVAATANRYLIGGTSAGATYIRVSSSFALTSLWGSTLTIADGAVSANSLANLVNGGSSKLYKNGSVLVSGANGSASLPSSARIGSGGTSASSWFTDGGATISEMIIFGSDPTGLAGWSAFESAARDYYA
jgi:hypothetical protein